MNIGKQSNWWLEADKRDPQNITLNDEPSQRKPDKVMTSQNSY